MSAADEHRWKVDVDKRLDRLCSFADDYEEYLKLCLLREKRKSKLQEAVIEKTIGGLVWSGLIFLGLAIWQYMREHLK